jgi:hypothetical protein
MSTKQFETEKYGTVLVRDVMVDTNGTDLESGVEIELIDDDNLLEVVGYSVDDFDDDFECLYNVIESQI